MQFAQELDVRTYNIRSYDKGEVVVTVPPDKGDIAAATESLDDAPFGLAQLRQERLTRSAIVMPTQLIRDWEPQSFEALAQNHFAQLAELRPEIVLLGSGATLRWPDTSLLQSLVNRSIGFEVMDTAAACRTYNILTFEGRMVAAALLMI